MRVVAGKYKGKRWDVPHTFKARPTTDFAKEGLFNILHNVYVNFSDQPSALDLFCGTGSISLDKFVKGHTATYDLIFADPPYALENLKDLPDLIFHTETPLLNPDGLFVLEHGRNYDFSSHPHYVEHRNYGSVNFSFFQ